MKDVYLCHPVRSAVGKFGGTLSSVRPDDLAADIFKALLARALSLLDVAQSSADLAIPGFRSHELKGDLAGHWSIWVNGNWRVTFRFIGQDVELVDYQDYH